MIDLFLFARDVEAHTGIYPRLKLDRKPRRNLVSGFSGALLRNFAYSHPNTLQQSHELRHPFVAGLEAHEIASARVEYRLTRNIALAVHQPNNERLSLLIRQIGKPRLIARSFPQPSANFLIAKAQRVIRLRAFLYCMRADVHRTTRHAIERIAHRMCEIKVYRVQPEYKISFLGMGYAPITKVNA